MIEISSTEKTMPVTVPKLPAFSSVKAAKGFSLPSLFGGLVKKAAHLNAQRAVKRWAKSGGAIDGTPSGLTLEAANPFPYASGTPRKKHSVFVDRGL